jgi:hypothetical protein
MEFHRIEELPRYRDIGIEMSWGTPVSISPALTKEAMARAHLLRSQAAYRIFGALARRAIDALVRARLRRAERGGD